MTKTIILGSVATNYNPGSSITFQLFMNYAQEKKYQEAVIKWELRKKN